MKKYIVEHEYDGYEIGTYLKETKGYSSRGLRNLEIYLNGKRIKNNKNNSTFTIELLWGTNNLIYAKYLKQYLTSYWMKNSIVLFFY